MLRKLLLATLLAAGTVGGIAMNPVTASAADNRGFDDRRDHGDHGDFRRSAKFAVLVRHGWHWHEHDTYRDRDDAERAARRLERQGYDTRIQRERW